MAHPLTQQPPSALPFQFAARPSPLGFGFGSPAATPHTYSTSLAHTSPKPLVNWQPVPLPSTSNRPSPARLRYSTPAPQSGSLKRSRQTRSPSSSPPGSPAQSSDSSSPRVRHETIAKQDLVKVSQLGPGDGSSSSIHSRKIIKRIKAENPSSVGSSALANVDVGVMLAALPPTAHLPILMHVLRTDPSLAEVILPQIPALDTRVCLNELQGMIDKVERAAGPINVNTDASINIWETRRWDRARTDIELFCTTASTYLSHTRSTFRQSPFDPQPLFALLQFITTRLKPILGLIPSPVAGQYETQATDKCRMPLDLAKLVLSTWADWVDELAVDVTQRGGMFPHSLASTWQSTLDGLVFESVDAPVVPIYRNTHWSFSSPDIASSSSPTTHPFVTQFQAALVPVRDKFMSELGWLVGR